MNIYVSNISFRTRKENLQAAFERYGAESSVKSLKIRRHIVAKDLV